MEEFKKDAVIAIDLGEDSDRTAISFKCVCGVDLFDWTEIAAEDITTSFENSQGCIDSRITFKCGFCGRRCGLNLLVELAAPEAK